VLKREEDNKFFTIFGHCFSTKLNTSTGLVYKVISLFKFPKRMEYGWF